jgi:hypothetical protein
MRVSNAFLGNKTELDMLWSLTTENFIYKDSIGKDAESLKYKEDTVNKNYFKVKNLRSPNSHMESPSPPI